MEWWQYLIAGLFVLPIAYVFIFEFLYAAIHDMKRTKEYRKKYIRWDEEHTDLQRRSCIGCKYCKSETHWLRWGHYRYPERVPVFCAKTHKNLPKNRELLVCTIAEPTDYFYEPKDYKHLYPKKGQTVFFSAYGNCYHSTVECSSIKNSYHIRTLEYGSMFLYDRYPCPKCWEEINNTLYPKSKKGV